MLDVLWSAAAFVVAIGVLVAFHEWGHFWTARRLGVRVLRYSIGFGKPLFTRLGKDGTEYVLAAIPLGGYVKMLDEREGPVPRELRSQAFNTQPVWKRIAIVLAGPVANFIFALVAYWAIFVIGVSGLKTFIGPVPEHSVAASAGLQKGDLIVEFHGRKMQAWADLRPALMEAVLDGGTRTLMVDRVGVRETISIDFSSLPADPEKMFAALGMDPMQPELAPIMGQIVAGEAAERAGLLSGDRILAADGEPMPTWMAWRDWLRERPLKAVEVEIERDGVVLTLPVMIGERIEDGKRVGRLGAGVAAQPKLWQDLRATYRLSPVSAVGAAATRTFEMSKLTLQMLGRMIVGEVSVRNVSGPIHIAQYAGSTAAAGLISFLSFLAIISVSLGVLNLLPVPMLDGGHLLYYLVELVKGSPLSDRIQMMGQQVGIVALMLLMSVAFYNDISRIVG